MSFAGGPIVQQAGTGLGIVGDGKGWSGGATRPDGEANQPQQIKEKRPKVFLEVELNKKALGRIVIELFGDVVPKTVENFRCLCTGERGISPHSGEALCYRGCKFHRIIPSKVIQGGDITKGNGTGGDSIYNHDTDACFPDENFKLRHDRPGLVSMAHKGGEAGKNCSQFFFITQPSPQFDGKHVVFGRIIQGLDLMTKMESMGTKTGKPLYEVRISDSGELESEAMKRRKRKMGNTEEALPPGWEKKESRNQPGLFYYQHVDGYKQFDRPSIRASDPLAAMAEASKRRREEKATLSSKRAEADDSMPDLQGILPARACHEGEIRVWHILKKHRDFFGKPAKSWRKKDITWSKEEAMQALEAIRAKLVNVGYGGGQQALQKKFENLAHQESDDDVSAKVGGDLGPLTKKRKLFGGLELIKAAAELKVGDLSKVIETKEGVHLLARFE